MRFAASSASFVTSLAMANGLDVASGLLVDLGGLQLSADVQLDMESLQPPPYYLLDDYAPSKFFDAFDFFTDLDPTRGFVQYVNESYARSNELISDSTDKIRIGVDHTNTFNRIGNQGVDTGRPSVRLQSKARYTQGLFILSLNHMPWGCGTWPAWWTLGKDWPLMGEIDMIENVNAATNNLMSAHTGQNCTLAGQGQTGNLTASNCFSDGWKNPGCTSESNSKSSFGEGFNEQGGGTYAMEWTSDYIRVWNWARGSEPANLVYGVPDPRRWGTPAANHQGSCDIDTHFREHQIVFDITFCGEWAGNTYATSGCPQASGLNGTESCKAYVARNPSAFQDTYWDINYLHVYKQSPTTSSSTYSSTSPLSSVTPVHTSTSVYFGQGASTTETKSASATVVVPPQGVSSTTCMMVSPTTVSIAGAYTYTACVANDVVPSGAAHYSKTINSVEDCSNFCLSEAEDSPYLGMAIENGTDCYCFNTPGTYPPKVTDACTVPCVSSTVEAYGGTAAVMQYVAIGETYSPSATTTGTSTPAETTESNISIFTTPSSVTDGEMMSTTKPTPTASWSSYGWPSNFSTATTTMMTETTSATASGSSSLATYVDPEEPVGGAYFVNKYMNTARIYASASVSGGAPLAAYSALASTNFTDCLNQCDDVTNNELARTGGNYLYCIAAVFTNRTDTDPDTNCKLIGNPSCYDAATDTDTCGDAGMNDGSGSTTSSITDSSAPSSAESASSSTTSFSSIYDTGNSTTATANSTATVSSPTSTEESSATPTANEGDLPIEPFSIEGSTEGSSEGSSDGSSEGSSGDTGNSTAGANANSFPETTFPEEEQDLSLTEEPSPERLVKRADMSTSDLSTESTDADSALTDEDFLSGVDVNADFVNMMLADDNEIPDIDEEVMDADVADVADNTEAADEAAALEADYAIDDADFDAEDAMYGKAKRMARMARLRRQTTNGLTVVTAPDSYVAYFVLDAGDATPVDPAASAAGPGTTTTSLTTMPTTEAPTSVAVITSVVYVTTCAPASSNGTTTNGTFFKS